MIADHGLKIMSTFLLKIELSEEFLGRNSCGKRNNVLSIGLKLFVNVNLIIIIIIMQSFQFVVRMPITK